MQKRQSENDFDSEFASTVAQTSRQRQFLRVGQIVDVVGNVNGLPIDQSPGKLFAVEDTLFAVGVIPKDIVLVLDQGTFRIVASASGGLLASLLLAFILAETVVFGELRLLSRLRLGLARKEFLQPVNLSFKLLDPLELPLDRFGLLLQLVLIVVSSHAQYIHDISGQENSCFSAGGENGQLRQTVAAATAAAIDCGKLRCKTWPTISGFRSISVTFRQEPVSGTRSNIECSVSSPKTGVVGH